MEEIIVKKGFKDMDEFNSLVASVDMSSIEKLKAFREWQTEDGSKEGLVSLIDGLKTNNGNGMKISLESVQEFGHALKGALPVSVLTSVRDADDDIGEHIEVSIPLIGNTIPVDELEDTVVYAAAIFNLQLKDTAEHDFLVLRFVDADEVTI